MFTPTQLSILRSLCLLIFVLHSTTGQGFNSPCFDDSRCPFPLYCHSDGVGIPRVCRCDPNVSIEHPNRTTGAPDCIVYAHDVFDPCVIIDGFDVCRNIDGSTCNGQVCDCIPDTHFLYQDLSNRNSCIPYVGLGDVCVLPEQCAMIGNGECDVTRRCVCRSGHYESLLPIRRCVKFAEKFNDTCTEERECDQLGEGVTCLDQQCNCDSASYSIHPDPPERCLLFRSNLQEPCVPRSQQCDRMSGAECSEDTSTCACNPLHATSSNELSCLPLVQNLFQRCELGTQPGHCSLIDQSFCNPLPLRCECVTGYVPHGTTACLKVAEQLLDSCVINEQCIPLGTGVVCEMGQCQCDADFFPHQGNCRPFSSALGDSCIPGTEQCRRITGATCSEQTSVCVCDHTTHADHQVEARCLPLVTTLGGMCVVATNPEQCSKIPGAHCSVSTLRCECQPGHFPEGTGTCHKTAENLLDSCSILEQCLPLGDGVSCDQGQCRCAAGYFPYQQEGINCLPFSTAIGQPCRPGTIQCDNIQGSVCSQESLSCICNSQTHTTHPNQPSCLSFATALMERCVPVADPDHCSRIQGAFCNAATIRCECDRDHQQQGDECISFTDTPFGPCRNTTDCTGTPNTICVEGVCACDDVGGYDLAEDTRSCFQRPTLVEGECQAPHNCRNLPNTSCRELRCSCNDNFVVGSQGNSCLGIVGKIGSGCGETVQCAAGIGNAAECAAGFCRCSSGYLDIIEEGAVNDKCLPPSDVDGPCERQIQCTHGLGEEAECVEATCKCKALAGYMNGRCYRRLAINESCSFSQECVLGVNENAQCLEGMCACRPSTEEVNGLCHNPMRVGSDCESSAECRQFIKGTVYCTSGKCSCSTNSRPSTDLLTCGAWAIGRLSFWSIIIITSLSIVNNFKFLRMVL